MVCTRSIHCIPQSIILNTEEEQPNRTHIIKDQVRDKVKKKVVLSFTRSSPDCISVYTKVFIVDTISGVSTHQSDCGIYIRNLHIALDRAQKLDCQLV